LSLLLYYSGGSRLPRHRHVPAYAAVVLSGEFVEAGDAGRHRLETGKVVFHPPFEAHRDDFGQAGAVILNVPLGRCPAFATGELAELHGVIRLARRDPQAAAAALLEDARPVKVALSDWPDALARALADDPELSLANWAVQSGLSAQTLSRGFRQAYGTTPKRFRAEHRAQRAVRALAAWGGTLAKLAAELGFADQAHLTRAVVSLTGATPGQLRAKWVQDGRHAPG
jgi:AraC-like DNA-binding protein